MDCDPLVVLFVCFLTFWGRLSMNPLAKYIIPYPTQIIFLPFFPSLFNVQFYYPPGPISIVKCAHINYQDKCRGPRINYIKTFHIFTLLPPPRLKLLSRGWIYIRLSVNKSRVNVKCNRCGDSFIQLFPIVHNSCVPIVQSSNRRNWDRHCCTW